MLTIAVSCLGLPAPVLAEPELADSRSVRDGFIDEVLGLADDAPLCASPSPPPLSPSPSSTVTLIPDTLESTSLEVCASPGGLTVFSEATLYLSSSTSVGFEIDGTVSANGASALTMSAGSEEEPWVPLPNLLPDFTMPALTGELKLDGDGGVSFELTAEPSGSFTMADGMLEFKDWGGSLAVTAPSTTVDVAAAGKMRIGGDEGFDASVSAAFRFEDGGATATVGIEHGGGWSPIPSGPLREAFETPTFSGTLVVGGEAHFSLEASAEWADPLVLLPDVIEVQAIGDSQAGPSLDVALVDVELQADEEGANVDWAVNFEGSVAIVALRDLPTLGIEGALCSTGASTLTMSAGSEEEPWVPLPDLIPDFTMPALAGEPHQNHRTFATALAHAPSRTCWPNRHARAAARCRATVD